MSCLISLIRRSIILFSAHFHYYCYHHFRPAEGEGDGVSDEKGSYLYLTTGSACSQVEIDCLTGDHTILRTDIVVDAGCSLNPAIDVGQVEGAFIYVNYKRF